MVLRISIEIYTHSIDIPVQIGLTMKKQEYEMKAFRTVPTYFTVRVSSTDTTYQRPFRVLIKIDGISPPNYPPIDLYGVEKKQQNYVVNNNPQLVGAISAYFYPTVSAQIKSSFPVALLHLHYRSVDELRQ
ncbi:28940_t:CDS:2, partial [Racocetra persica]